MFSPRSLFVALLLAITTTGTALTYTQEGDDYRTHYRRGCETLLERREW
jgi:hypothetical protein